MNPLGASGFQSPPSVVPGGAFDDGDGGLGFPGNASGKAEFRPDHSVHRLHGDPTVGRHLFLTPDQVGEQDRVLRTVEPGEGRKTLDVLHLGIRADHVGLAGKDEDAYGVGVALRIGVVGSGARCHGSQHQSGHEGQKLGHIDY